MSNNQLIDGCSASYKAWRKAFKDWPPYPHPQDEGAAAWDRAAWQAWQAQQVRLNKLIDAAKDVLVANNQDSGAVFQMEIKKLKSVIEETGQ
jgi:hypothetical protein